MVQLLMRRMLWTPMKTQVQDQTSKKKRPSMNVSVTMWMSLFFDVFTGTFYQMCLNVFFGDYEYCVRPAVWHCHLPQTECPPATRNQTMQLIHNRSKWKLKLWMHQQTHCWLQRHVRNILCFQFCPYFCGLTLMSESNHRTVNKVGRNDQNMRSYFKLNIILYFSHTGVCQHKCFKCFNAIVPPWRL